MKEELDRHSLLFKIGLSSIRLNHLIISLRMMGDFLLVMGYG